MTDRSCNAECPVCLEDLFDNKGIATRDVAEIMCPHLIHSECLSEAGKALNADGQRYGFGGMGARAGCPICDTAVSCWTTSKEAASFKSFWTLRIENALLEIGPNNTSTGTKMPVSGEVVRNKVKESPTLSEQQKRFVSRNDGASYAGFDESGFRKALDWAGSVEYNVHEVMYARFLITRGIWKYDKEQDMFWHWNWGLQHPRLTTCACCSSQPPNLKVCSSCKESCEAPLYCNVDCQKNHWKSAHKKQCKQFQIMKQGGTQEELVERLGELSQNG